MLIGTVCTKKMVIKNCKVILQDRIRDNVDVIVKGDKILKIVSNINETYDTDVIDGKGRYLIPGYVDIHCHGSNGYDFMDNTLTAIKEICQYNIKNGVLSLVPTTLSSDLYELLEFLCIISKLDFNDMHFANIEGIHLEGPYFSLSNAGAQDKKYIHVPNQKEISKILNVTDKIHLVPMLDEPFYLSPGLNQPNNFSINGIQASQIICYDLRYPEVARASIKNDANFITSTCH